jgi:hypothetical protein
MLRPGMLLTRLRAMLQRAVLMVGTLAVVTAASAPVCADDVLIDTATDIQVDVRLQSLQVNTWGDAQATIASPVTCMNNATHEAHSTPLLLLMKKHVTNPAAFERMYAALLAAHLAGRSVRLQLTGYRLASGQKLCSIYRVIVN